MKFTIILLTIMIVLLIIYIINMKQTIKSISKDIKNNKNKYVNIRTKAINSDLEKLVVDINSIYDNGQKINAENNRMEEELKQSIANISHDLRTPLTSISGYVQLLKMDNLSESEEKEYLNIIDKRVASLQGLITTFYDLSKINSDGYVFNLEKVKLDSILCDNLAMYYSDFQSKGLEPVIEIEENLPSIISDKKALSRIFSNLIVNILKYGKGDIKITIKKKEDYIVAEFINYAPDIDNNKVDRLFDRFYTGDKSRNDKSSGLGLFIVKSLIEKLDHEINAESVDDMLKICIKFGIK